MGLGEDDEKLSEGGGDGKGGEGEEEGEEEEEEVEEEKKKYHLASPWTCVRRSVCVNCSTRFSTLVILTCREPSVGMCHRLRARQRTYKTAEK
jgi:hypothetical protein